MLGLPESIVCLERMPLLWIYEFSSDVLRSRGTTTLEWWMWPKVLIRIKHVRYVMMSKT